MKLREYEVTVEWAREDMDRLESLEMLYALDETHAAFCAGLIVDKEGHPMSVEVVPVSEDPAS